MILRKATAADINTLAQHNNMMAQETENKSLDLPTVQKGVKAVIDDPMKGFYLLVDIDGQIAANLMITYEWSDWRNSNIWWVQSVYVQQQHRRKGLYKMLYNEIKRLAKQEGIGVLRLYVEQENTVAQKTYSSLGMQHSYYQLYEESI